MPIASSALQDLFQEALRHHQARRLAEAERLYRQVLAVDARHSPSLQFLGLIAHQMGRNDDAVELIGRAIALKSDEPIYHLHLGLALKSQGRLDEAVASYDRALTLKSDLAEAHNNRAVALRAAGKLGEALAACGRALLHKPDFAEAHSNRGDLLRDLGRLNEAVASYDRALALNPGFASIYYWRGNALMALGNLEEATASFDRALALRADYADCHACRADALYGQRRLEEALTGYDRALALKPDFVAVHHNRGNVLNELGRPEEALESYDRAIALQPALAETHNNRANVLRDRGAGDLAIETYDRAIALKPGFASAHYNRGIALNNLARFEEAVASYDRALALEPDLAEVHLDRAAALKNLGRLDEAAAGYERALSLRTDNARAHMGRAETRYRQGKLQDALEGYERTLDLDPDLAAAHYSRGNVLHELGRREEAMTSYDRAIVLAPDFAEAYNNRANMLQARGEQDLAIADYDRAIALKPEFSQAHHNRGNVLNNQGKCEEAIASFDRAIALKPDYAAAHRNRGLALRNLGLHDRATEGFKRAWAIQPGSFEYACLSKLSPPIIAASTNDSLAHRRRFRNGLDDLMNFDGDLQSLDTIEAGFLFYLAYAGLDDRPTLQAVDKLFRTKASFLTFDAPHVKEWTPPEGRRRIAVGFISEYFRNHTIAKLYRGFIGNLDRSRFEVVLIHASQTQRDSESNRLDAAADKVLRLPSSLPLQQEAIAEQRLDILFYPDIGMSKETYFLAYARLAPVQAVSWGHPNTTGLASIDYFISANGVEPPEAELHYSERLIRLSRLPCFYELPKVPDAIPDRAELGLPRDGTLYGCPQSLFKLHPDFDGILARIAAEDREGHIVLVEGLYSTWTDLLRQRWSQSHPLLLERVHFVRQQPLDRFMALMAHFDVLLDPIHFGSGNTLYEAMAFGTPIVTWPGYFMRGRIVAGAYRQMGVANAPIAQAQRDYAPLALALGRDPTRRQALRRALRDASDELFADRQAVRDFETFVESAVDAAGRRSRLPTGWQPGAQDTALP